MALGNNYDNKKQYSPTVYSAYRMNNAESTIDPTCMTYTFWNNSLKISISPKKTNCGENISFDFDNSISIYLTHTKALILAKELEKFMQDPDKYNSCGVPSGAGIITFSNGTEFGKPGTYCVVIRKVNSGTGEIESAFVYEIKSEYYFAVRGYDSNKNSFETEKEDYRLLELQQMYTLLIEYTKAMTSAAAYSVVDNMKFDMSRINTKLVKIAEKVGADLGYKNQSYSNKSYFNQNSNNNSNSQSNDYSYSDASLDDIENDIY